MAVEQKETTQEELARHLAVLNENWQKYDDIKKNRIEFDSPRARGDAARLALKFYTYEELWLAARGYPWHALKYDKATRTHSLP